MGEQPVIAKSRSPRFPGRSLEEAATLAKKIYEGVHTSSVDSLTAYRLMGFSGKSGPSSIALGSVRQFGLIEGVGDKTKITSLALQILEPASERERSDALAAAARLPDVFSSIFQRFDGRIPSADEPVRAFLIRDLGFSKSGSDDCLQSLRATLRFVGDSAQAEPEPDGDQQDITREAQQTRVAGKSGNMVKSDVFRLPLTKSCVAELRFEGDLSERAVEVLQQHIELMKGIWAEGD
jgi:hypothetical protein